MQPSRRNPGRLAKWWRRRRVMADAAKHPAAAMTGWKPRVRVLERRLVLNATAELTALGELVIQGDVGNDFVQVQHAATDDVRLFDADASLIPIQVGTDGVGNPVYADSIQRSEITAGSLRIDLGAGDDVAVTPLIDGLDIDVTGGDGRDRVVLESPVINGSSADEVTIDSEQVVLAPRSGAFDAQGDRLTITGRTDVGQPDQSTLVDLGDGSIRIDGMLVVSGDVTVQATQGPVELTGVSTAATNVESSLTFQLGSTVDLNLGDVDRSVGEPLHDVTIRGGDQIQLSGNTIDVSGSLAIDSPDSNVSIRSDITANQFTVNARQMELVDLQLKTSEDLVLSVPTTLEGDVDLVTEQDLIIESELASTGGNDSLLIRSGDSVRIEQALLVQGDLDVGAENQIILTGDVSVADDVQLQATETLLDSSLTAGDVTVTGPISGTDGTIDAVDQIWVDASSDPLDLTGLHFKSAGIVLGNATVVRLGTMQAEALTIGAPAQPIVGDVQQASGQAIDVDHLSVYADGAIDLSQPGNQIDIVDQLVAGRSIQLHSDVALRVGAVDAGENVDLSAQRIDAIDGTDARIDANGLILRADEGIGGVTPMRLADLRTLDAVTTDGDITLDWLGSADAEVSQLRADGGSIMVDRDGAGDLRLVDVSASGGIDVVNHQAGLVLPAGANVESPGLVRLTAGDAQGSLGEIRMEDGAAVISTENVVRLSASSDMTLGTVVSGSTDDDAIRVTSVTGAVRDAGDSDIDLVAESGGVVIRSHSGIGDGDAIETQVQTLDGFVSSSGAVAIDEQDSIRIQRLQTADGGIDVRSAGTMEAMLVHTENQFGSDGADGSADSRDIRLETTGAGSDLLVGRVQADLNADVRLVSADDVMSINAVVGVVDSQTASVAADDLVVIAANDVADQAESISLTTAIGDLVASIDGTNPGDLLIAETDSLRLASGDSRDDSGVIRTGNGAIDIRAAEDIVIDDFDPTNDGNDRKADPEIVAGGTSGTIQLRMGDSWIVGDSVQLHADATTGGAVDVEADTVSLGDDFEIMTGQGVGIARQFTPYPGEGVVADAFYDFDSVSTNILSQANLNDAEGTLSVDIGTEGETGFTLTIDWGAPVDRFQRVDNLPGDGATAQVSHVYLESDILSSTLNGRQSATDPLAVRFSVSHHESIQIQADRVFQGSDLPLQVDGRLVTSTDNPLTLDPAGPILENGRAFFVIPQVDVPVAFFPVRDVIPEPVELPTIVRQTETTFVTDASFQTSESTSLNVSISDEYFQLRTLSPDPASPDLIEPIRLPDDILDFQKLQRLFQQLPDGAYEIEYVAGDDDERSILRVDLRGGRPVILNDDLDGGTLKLTPLDATDGSDGNGDEISNSQEASADPSEDRESGDAAADQPPVDSFWPAEDGDAESLPPDEAPVQPFSRSSRFLRRIAAGIGDQNAGSS
ncbi:hypothetical protein V7x_04410 [Crateriforma conspicua]|uniref:Uncharacterized protein n=1 Tax=Crateriforma conspicua TaxID=2527996 RepID=A0A5C6FP19_9PLAN|nr:hypothetical protein [Crateriforma conspicua]TWU64897.1 hypothetical protein V7x_04410 [Crateriforma conspicua]